MECNNRRRRKAIIGAHSGQIGLLTSLVSCFECQEETDENLVEAFGEILAIVPQSPSNSRRWGGGKWLSSWRRDQPITQEAKTMKWITRMVWHRDENKKLNEFI